MPGPPEVHATAQPATDALPHYAAARRPRRARVTPARYDAFYRDVVLAARNGRKAEWLASYEPIVEFIERVRLDIDVLPEIVQRALAGAIHDNGYWKGQERRIHDTQDPLIGARFSADEAGLSRFLTATGLEAYRRRYEQGAGGYRIRLDAVSDRPALFAWEGKTIHDAASVPGDTVILNANAQSWSVLVADAAHYPNPDERLRVIVANQLNGVASALALLRASTPRTDAEMDFAMAVIWRYVGHRFGRGAWEREPLVRVPYERLSPVEQAKDRAVWMAVRDAMRA